MKRLLFLIFALLAACAPYTFHGSLIDPASPAPNFALMDQHGQTFQLSEQQGNVVLMYFGYTNCPDVCPATLAQWKRVKAELGREAERVRFVMVTVDPERDTAQRLREYLAGFDPSFIGLTGAIAELAPVWKAYGVYQQPLPALGEVDHTARIYVVDATGRLRLTYTMDTAAQDIAKDLRQLLKGK